MTRLLVLAAMLSATAATAQAQTLPVYGAPSVTYGTPIPDASNNVGVATYRFDNAEHRALKTFERRAVKRAAAAATAAATPTL